LAVVPEAFLAWLDAGPTSAEAAKPVRRWFEVRGIDAAGADATIRAFRQIARWIGGDGRNEAPASPAPSPRLGVVQVRLTPLELQRRTLPHLNGDAHIAWQCPDRRRHRFLVSARAMSRYEPFVRWAWNLPEPVVRHRGALVETPRILTGADGIDLPLPLQVAVYSQPDRVQFAWMLPPAGVRSVLNRVSAVRTGYLGCFVRHTSNLIDHPEPQRSWLQLRMAMRVRRETPEVEGPLLMPMPRNQAFDITPFRYLQIETIENLPYYYSAEVRVHSVFAGDVFVTRGEQETFQDEAARYRIGPGRRLPAFMAYRAPLIELREETEAAAFYDVTIHLTRQIEMTGPADRTSGVAPQFVTWKFPIVDGGEDDEAELTIDVGDLPDQSFRFEFVTPHAGRQSAERVADQPPGEKLYKPLFDLRMPWEEGYVVPDGEAVAAPMALAIDGAFWIVDSQGEAVRQAYVPIDLRPVEAEGAENQVTRVIPTLSFRLKVDRSGSGADFIENADRRFAQVGSFGRLSPVVPLQGAT
jgi:hypothetical protein